MKFLVDAQLPRRLIPLLQHICAQAAPPAYHQA
jgi:predicted nuclease of predicted toxin-antitoxin system